MNKEEFVLEVEKLGIKLDTEKLDKLDQFYHLLIIWNEKINLTTITKEEDVYLKHFYDSLTLFKEVNLNENLTICDVGSGAGFPGIVLKIVFPQLKLVLIDSLQKRVNYLNEIIKSLNLYNIVAIHSRMEDYARENVEKFDLITARAVANVKVLCEISVKSLKIGGRLVFMKANVEEEIDNIENMMKELGVGNFIINKFVLPKENSNRCLLSFEKMYRTRDKYPRNIDKIKKNSL